MMLSCALLAFLSFAAAQNWPPSICDPLVADFCTLPFPNDYWLLKDDNYNPIHLVLDEKNLPISRTGETVNPQDWNVLDGFSPLPAILTYFDDLSLENSNLPRLWNIADSENENTPIVILEASTMRRIPYWAELDHNSDIDGHQQNRTFMVWPAFRLEDGERYIIGMRGLQNSMNELCGPSPGFEALRDNIATNNPAIEERRTYFDKYIFEPLVANGVDRNTLQIAWDFTVMSTKQQTTRMINMRDDALTRIPWNQGGVKYRILLVEDNYSDYVFRRISGTMSVPWYLNKRLPGADVRMITQWDNPLMPVYQREEQVFFEVLIPHSVANGTKEARFLQFGHGLFQGIFVILVEQPQQIWDEWGYIVGGVNWLGMCYEDLGAITDILATNLTNFPAIPDRLHQGMLNALFYQELIVSPGFLADPVFVIDGKNIIPQIHIAHYWGGSLGGIMGSVFLSLATNITDGVCNVPGFPFSLLLPRSTDFDPFRDILRERYESNVDIVLIYSVAQLLWNRLSPSGYLHHMIRDPLIATPVHNVLLQYSLGDHQVSWLGAEQMGRSVNASMYRSNVPEYNETLYAMNWLEDDEEIDVFANPGQVMIQGWNYDQPQVPFDNLPPREGADTHSWTAFQYDAQEAAWNMYENGIISNACKGPCNGQKPLDYIKNRKYDPRSYHENKYKVYDVAKRLKQQNELRKKQSTSV